MHLSGGIDVCWYAFTACDGLEMVWTWCGHGVDMVLVTAVRSDVMNVLSESCSQGLSWSYSTEDRGIT